MNLTLEQAMAQATKGPLIVLDGEEQTERDVVHIPHSGIILKTVAEKPSLQDQINAGPINAALLAHWYNVGPELVKALKAVMKFYPALWEGEQDVLGALHNSAQDAESNANAILARSNTVTIPD